MMERPSRYSWKNNTNAQYVESLEEYCDHLEALTQWHDISTAPKDGQWIIVWDDDRCCEHNIVYWEDNSKKWIDRDGDVWFDPTYWKPLGPPPPTVNQPEEKPPICQDDVGGGP